MLRLDYIIKHQLELEQRFSTPMFDTELAAKIVGEDCKTMDTDNRRAAIAVALRISDLAIFMFEAPEDADLRVQNLIVRHYIQLINDLLWIATGKGGLVIANTDLMELLGDVTES